MKRGNFKNGEREGTWVGYHENGQLWIKGYYKNNKREGTWVSYHENGQLRSRGNYKDGEREGTWVFYNDIGNKRMFEIKIGTTVIDEGSGVYNRGKKVSE